MYLSETGIDFRKKRAGNGGALAHRGINAFLVDFTTKIVVNGQSLSANVISPRNEGREHSQPAFEVFLPDVASPPSPPEARFFILQKQKPRSDMSRFGVFLFRNV